MSGINTTNFQQNEIVKSSDVQDGMEYNITNIGAVVKVALESSMNVIIGGKVTAHSGMMCKVAPFIAYENSRNQLIVADEGEMYAEGATDPASFITFDTGAANRRDIVEIKSDWLLNNEQTRAFYDPDTDSTTSSDTLIDKHLIVRYKIKKGDAGSTAAPEVDEGYIKLCEVLVPGNSNSLTNENIFNITKDYINSAVTNDKWTNDKDSVINPGTLHDIRSVIRKAHNADGSHKDAVIKASNILLTGAGALTGSLISKGGNSVTLSNKVLDGNTSVAKCLEDIIEVMKTPKYWCDMMFPVGRIITITGDEDPNVTYPGTAWEKTAAGKCLIGAGTGTDKNNVSKTFNIGDTNIGEYTHSLGISELPQHYHTSNTHTHGLNSHTHNMQHYHNRGTLRIQGGVTYIGAGWTDPVATNALGIEKLSGGHTFGYGSSNYAFTHRTLTLDTNLNSGGGWSGKTSGSLANATSGDTTAKTATGGPSTTNTTGATTTAYGGVVNSSGETITGLGSAHNIMQPSVVVNFWKRTA